jgi:hypothetical protein
MIYAIPKTGFHVAPSLVTAMEFTLCNTNSKQLEEWVIPKSGRAFMPLELKKKGISKVLCGDIDGALLQELARLQIQVQPGFDEEVTTIIERIKWNCLDESDNDSSVELKSHGNELEQNQTHSANHQGCGSSCGCGGATIDSLLSQMAHVIKDPIPFDQTIIPKKPTS